MVARQLSAKLKGQPASSRWRLFHYSIALGTPHSLVDLFPVTTFVRRQRHNCIMDRGIDR
jgi:hypothetical protein